MGYFSHMVVINAICDILVSAEISGSYSNLIMVGYKWEMKDTPTNHNHIQKKLEGNSQRLVFSFFLLMSRSSRFLLSTWNSSAAQPPVAVEFESDFVLIIAALLCALICVVGLIAVARCAWLRRSSGSWITQPAANKGLKKKVLESLPKLTHDGSVSAKFAECAICLGEFVEGDQIRVLPQCGHGFHAACVDTWLSSHSSCPSCRQILIMARCSKCCSDLPTETELKG